MEVNEVLRKEILTVVSNQLKNNNPPETMLTYNRLIKEGYTKNDAKLYIGQCLGVELFRMLKYKESFNLKRYVKNLEQLPKEPFD